MLRKTNVLPASKVTDGLASRYQLVLACVAVILACVSVIGPAFARASYDGDWSVVIVTHGGACDASYRFGVQITHGAVINDGGGIATVQGQVAPTGIVKVTVRAGSQWAYGSGRLGKNYGSGVWRGQGTSGTCAGRWLAERRP
jgi:hypothetical protein